MQEIGSKVVEFFPEGYYRIIALVAFAAIVLNGMWIWAKKEDRKKIGKLVRRSLLICSLAGIAMFIAKLFLNNENTFKVGKTGVLILRILGDDNNSRQVDLIESIRAETRKNSTSSSVQVLASDVLLDDRKIDPVNAHQQARSIGQRLKAQVVIWGNLVDGKKFWPHITVVNTNSPPFASFEQEMNPQNLDQFDLPKELLTEPISLSLFLEAFALYQDGQHAKALKIFESSISFQPTNSPEIAPMLFFSATCRLYLQEKQLDPQKMLDSAVVELRSAADKFGTTNLFPFWEMAENNLGIALQSQSSHSESSNVVNLLIQSVSAFEGAIKSSKEKKFNWTIPAQNLNNTIGKLALLSEGKKATDLLQYAIAQNQELLAVLSHGSDSFSWALTKNNLGVDMRELGSRSAGKDLKNLLTDAVEEFHDSLGVFTRDKYPEFWALVSDNLGNALLVQAEQKGGASSEQLLKQAMQLFKDALQVQTRERSPQKWAWTANNLAAALILESEQANDIEAPILIDEAIAMYHQILEVSTRGQFPEDWAKIQNNLGVALIKSAFRKENTEKRIALANAEAALQRSLEVRSREHFPQNWAEIQMNLGTIFLYEAEGLPDDEAEQFLKKGIEAFRQSLEVRTKECCPQNWATSQKNLGRAMFELAKRSNQTNAVVLLNEAIGMFRQVLEIETRAEFPQGWAKTQFYLGSTLGWLAALNKDKEQAIECLNSFKAALKIWKPDEFPHEYNSTIQIVKPLEKALAE